MEEIEQLCDGGGFIDKGKLVEHRTMQQVIGTYAQTTIFVKGKGITFELLTTFGEVSKKDMGDYCFRSKEEYTR